MCAPVIMDGEHYNKVWVSNLFQLVYRNFWMIQVRDCTIYNYLDANIMLSHFFQFLSNVIIMTIKAHYWYIHICFKCVLTIEYLVIRYLNFYYININVTPKKIYLFFNFSFFTWDARLVSIFLVFEILYAQTCRRILKYQMDEMTIKRK